MFGNTYQSTLKGGTPCSTARSNKKMPFHFNYGYHIIPVAVNFLQVVPKGLEEEGAVLKLNTESIRVDTVEENFQEDREVKKLNKPELEADNRILQKGADDNKEDEKPNEEVRLNIKIEAFSCQSLACLFFFLAFSEITSIIRA